MGADAGIERAWRLAALLGHVVPSERQLEEAAALVRGPRRPDPRWLLRVCTVQGVVAHVLAQLERMPAADVEGLEPFLTEARATGAAMRAEIAVLFDQLAVFARGAQERGIRFLAIKGAHLQSLYPDPAQRVMGDIDLLLHGDSCWTAVEILAEMGYTPRRLKLDASLPGRSLADRTGILQIDWQGGGDDQFDLHLGGFPACGGIVVEADLWASTETIPVGGLEVPVPRLHDAIVILCAHISRHGHATLRDLNDLYVCLSGGELEPERLLVELRRNAVHPILAGLVARLPEAERARIPAALSARTRRPAARLAGRLLTASNEKLIAEDKEGQSLPGQSFGMSPWRFFAGRLAQATFLYHHARRRHGRPAALGRAARGLYHLWRYGRPFRTRQDGAVDDPIRRLVAVPLDGASGDGAEARVERRLDEAAIHATARGRRVAWVGPGVLAWDVGSPHELLLTPHLVFAPAAAYDGSLDVATRRRLEQRAHELATELHAVAAAAEPATQRPS